MFKDDEAGCDRSVADWFNEKHPGARFDPNLPCVLVGKRSEPGSVKVPLELLHLCDAQPPQSTQAEIASAMIKECSKVPAERFKMIDGICKDYATGKVGTTDEAQEESRQRFGAFTLAFDRQGLAEVPARVLDPCEVIYKRNDRDEGTRPDGKGSWNLRNGLSFVEPQEARDWAIVICVDQVSFS
mmetsp:Transcript_10814/g.34253  ORF Transcript_10814/g.34253 Transcript_10814/m.34253 type:complete len:185 (+) Transcript_10814:2-556(+)